MHGAPVRPPAADRAVRVIDDDPGRAAEARAQIQRIFERMDRFDRIVAGRQAHRSRYRFGLALRAPVRVPRRTVGIGARRPNRRVPALANRRAPGGRRGRGRDPDRPRRAEPPFTDLAGVPPTTPARLRGAG